MPASAFKAVTRRVAAPNDLIWFGKSQQRKVKIALALSLQRTRTGTSLQMGRAGIAREWCEPRLRHRWRRASCPARPTHLHVALMSRPLRRLLPAAYFAASAPAIATWAS
jgi:hypothetical protein